jgi:hypothetical protein
MNEPTGSDLRSDESAQTAVPSDEPVPTPGGRRALRLDAIAVGVIIAAYGIVQYVVFPGPQRFDPSFYFDVANRFPDVDPNWWTLRIGLIAPLHVVIAVLGESEVALYTIPVASAILLGTSVFAMMRVLFQDRVVASATALVVMLNPNHLLNSAYIFPDTTATATFTAALLLVILGRPREAEGPRWLSTATVVAAGVLLGWSYLIREFTPILLPAVIVAVLLFRYPRGRIAVLAGSALGTVALEPVYGAIRYGNPFERLHVLLDRSSVSAPSHHTDWAPFRAQVNNVFDAVLVLPRLLLAWNEGWVLVALIFVFIVALLRFRGTALLVLGTWLFSYWAVMVILALTRNTSGDPMLNVANVRYWYPVLPALVMGGLGGLALLIRGPTPSLQRVRLSQAAVIATAALVLVPGTIQYSSCAARHVWPNDTASSWNDVRSWLATPQAERFNAIRTDPITRRTLVVYTHSRFGSTVWHGFVGQTTPSHPPAPGPHRLILVNVAASTRGSATALLASWSPVFVSSDGRLAVLAPRSVVATVHATARHRWLSTYGPRHLVPGTCGLSPYQAG